MKLGIVSDTHDRSERAARALRIFEREGVGAILHCGDVTDAEVVYALAGGPVCHFVRGNCDYDEDPLREAVERLGGVWHGKSGELEFEGARIAFAHGDSPKLVERLLAKGPDYFFHGHTHLKRAAERDHTLIVNPGALERAAVHTVAIVDLAARTANFATIPRD